MEERRFGVFNNLGNAENNLGRILGKDPALPPPLLPEIWVNKYSSLGILEEKLWQGLVLVRWEH